MSDSKESMRSECIANMELIISSPAVFVATKHAKSNIKSIGQNIVKMDLQHSAIILMKNGGHLIQKTIMILLSFASYVKANRLKI